MVKREKLLMVTPATPNPLGGGTSIRAAMLLESAAAHFDVFVLVALLEKPGTPALAERPSRFLRERAVRVEAIPLLAQQDPSIDQLVGFRDGSMSPEAVVAFFQNRMKLARARQTTEDDFLFEPFICALTLRYLKRVHYRPFADIDFAAVLTISTQLMPFAFGYLEATDRPRCIIDLNDIDSTKHRRFSKLHRLNHSAALAATAADEAERLERFERMHLPRFDLVLTCSIVDRDEVAARIGIRNIEIAPNAIPEPTIGDHPQGVPVTDFLFVGTLGYFPNADAITYFCREILPRIGERLGRPPTFRIIGRDVPAPLRRVELIPGVTICSDVEELAPHYASAHACVIPLRAGSGTRLKALEAFGYFKPVVSTSMGIEGIDVIGGEHLLIADDAEGFADACCRILADPPLSRRLGKQACELVRSRYTFSKVCPMVGDIIAAPQRAVDAQTSLR
jgi:glycosyltransferase involved in cell wall biosynthesis